MLIPMSGLCIAEKIKEENIVSGIILSKDDNKTKKAKIIKSRIEGVDDNKIVIYRDILAEVIWEGKNYLILNEENIIAFIE
jgi:co-chaperonin GroES (HSP10)